MTNSRPVTKIQVEAVSKNYFAQGTRLNVLDSISLEVNAGEFVCLVGKSGCGKSTLLHIVSGLDKPSSGSVYLDGQPVARPTPRIGMVFQKFSLYPWLTVEQNIAFGLVSAGRRNDTDRRVKQLVELMGLRGFARSLPSQLSGGMAQRVSLARTLAIEPEVLLFDEPLGALDAFTRMAMQEEIAQLWERQGFTALFVTHDIEEALFLGSKVAIMTPRPGRIHRILDVKLPRPRDRTSADFLHLREEVFREFHLTRELTPDYTI